LSVDFAAGIVVRFYLCKDECTNDTIDKKTGGKNDEKM